MIQANPDMPCAVGFGISTPEQAAKMADLSDGAIVGSAIIRLRSLLTNICFRHILRLLR